MPNKILVNGVEYDINEEVLPCLITYPEQSGGSQLSISLIADLFLAGEKVLFITAFPQGKENFMERIKGEEARTTYVTDEKQLNANAQAIVLESGNEKLLLDAIAGLADIGERIIFIKNIETFTSKVFDACLGFKKIILSGDLDKCTDKERIVKKEYKTTIDFKVPALPKYTGYFKGEKDEGEIKLEM